MPHIPLESTGARDSHKQPPTHQRDGQTTRYTATAIVLHWVLGAAVVGMFFVGLYMSNLPFSLTRLKLFNWHKWAGMCLLALSAVRLIWRLTHVPPVLPTPIATAMPAWQHRAHSATHLALYALFFFVPLVGWAYSSAAGFPIVLFGVLPLPDFVPANKALAALIRPWHEMSAFALMGLAALHAAAALKHQWWDGDGLVGRMLLGRR
jgi:cytochrome b561